MTPAPTQQTKTPARRCRAISRSTGVRCKAPAIRGGTVCRMHGGSAPQVKAKAKRNLERHHAEKVLAIAIEDFELSDIHPAEAILNEVRTGAAMQAYLRQQVASLTSDEIAGMFTASERYDEETDTTVITKVVGGNIWVKLLGEWSDRTARISKMALDAGIAERQVRVIEQQAGLFATALWSILEEFGIEQGPETITVVRRHMLAIKDGDEV